MLIPEVKLSQLPLCLTFTKSFALPLGYSGYPELNLQTINSYYIKKHMENI